MKQHEWDWAGAEREYRRAIELNPSLVEAHNRYAEYLSVMERHAEALAEIKRAQELDPLQIRLRRREAFRAALRPGPRTEAADVQAGVARSGAQWPRLHL